MPAEEAHSKTGRNRNNRTARFVLMAVALIVALIVAGALYKLFLAKPDVTEDVQIENENEEDKPKETIEPPKPEEDEEFFEFLDEDATMKLIVPKGTTFREGAYNKTKWFMGDYETSGIRGHINQEPTDVDGDCNKYTDKFLSHLDDPGDGYVTFAHKSGAVACVWEGIDTNMGMYVEEFYIVNDGVEYNIVITNSIDESTGKSTKKIRVRGEINLGELEHIVFDGFESGDMEVWGEGI